MTALPKRKPSTRRKGARRSQIHLSLPKIIPCSYCHQPKRASYACPNCHKK